MRSDQFPKPFWRAARYAWFVQIAGKQIKLGTDKSEAFRLYHELMARKPNEPMPSPVAAQPDEIAAVTLIDEFLHWTKNNRERPTFEAYQRRLNYLTTSIPVALPAVDLRPFHLTRVMDAHEWNPTTKNDFAVAVNRAYNWAVKQGLFDRNPVAGIEKSTREVKELSLSPAEYAEVMGHVTEPNFRLLLEVAWETGARVQDLRKIEVRYCEPANHRIVFPPKESKGKKTRRVIHLGTERAQELIVAQIKQHPTEPILRNSEANPWTKDAINNAFCRLKEKIGRKLHLGAWRKSFCTEALKNGVDVLRRVDKLWVV